LIGGLEEILDSNQTDQSVSFYPSLAGLSMRPPALKSICSTFAIVVARDFQRGAMNSDFFGYVSVGGE
jgi:hypothetical protein